MLAQTVSAGLQGIEALPVRVEVDIIKGLPRFTIVGLPDSTVKESKDRIRSAVENSGFDFPPKNFIVNLAPAGLRKEGAYFDLPIAFAILQATGQIDELQETIPMIGELSLDGSVKKANGVISMAIALYQAGYKKIIVPYENRNEASALEEIEVFPVKNILDVINVYAGKVKAYLYQKEQRKFKNFYCFSDVYGQETARRALEIAAAGQHNILLYGPPGSGKTMLARRLPTIMPELKREDAITVTKIHSAGGKLQNEEGLITESPFRAPHHTSSDVSLVGGGRTPSVGEISLAHNGVLFLDEFPEFKNNVIQSLRQPLEDKIVTVSRASGTAIFPADFMLVAAANPCPCGYLFDEEFKCTCSSRKINNYFSKISGPVLDRIDIEILVPRVPYKDLMQKGDAESSILIKERVLKARIIQSERFKNTQTNVNSRMTSREVKKFCLLSPEDEKFLENSCAKLNFSARSFFKILKVARTIADLEGQEQINRQNLLEALSYKSLNRTYQNLAQSEY